MKELQLFPQEVKAAPRRKGKTRRDFEDYEGFVEKFKPKKTTDDCYTPPAVYDAVLSFVQNRLGIGSRPVVRPFYPGGDFEHYDYPPDCVVVDNPPFSIYAKIVRFYLSHGIDFFLFASHLTCFVANADCSYILTNTGVTYENGAVVKTAFVTNLLPDLRVWLCPELRQAILQADKIQKPVIGKNTYPDHVISSAILGKVIEQDVELKVRKSDCVFISNLDALRARGTSLFGNGFLLSERAAAERAAGCTVQLSERELNIIRSL